MNLTNLAYLVDKAVATEPPEALAAYCGDQYRPYYHLLYLLALHTPHACVELGVEKGRGCFAMALAGREVWGIDHTRRAEIAVVQARFRNLRYLERDSLPPPPGLKGPVGLLHVDTEHSFAQAREEFWAYKPLLAEGAVACFDDAHAQEYQVAQFVVTLPWPTVFDDRLHECGYAAVAVG
jgi:hypothetical protein